jgi:hypothetical protein
LQKAKGGNAAKRWHAEEQWNNSRFYKSFSLFRGLCFFVSFSLQQTKKVMSSKSTVHNSMRIYHRYLGFFLAGIMAVYALSGVILIFRDTSFLKQTKQVQQQLQPGLSADALGKAIRSRDLKIDSVSGDVQIFKNGTYNSVTGAVNYTTKSLPKFIEKLTHLHKAGTKDPLFYLNVFFGVSLFFFVISSFWMFMPKTSIFKKGLYFTIAGIVLTIIMLLF